jgi:hypothetical protein
MFDTKNYILHDGLNDAISQAEDDARDIELQEALEDIKNDAWDTYERDMEIYALQHELQGCWNCMWDDYELTLELTELYTWNRSKFARLYEGVYTTLHPEDLARYINT